VSSNLLLNATAHHLNTPVFCLTWLKCVHLLSTSQRAYAHPDQPAQELHLLHALSPECPDTLHITARLFCRRELDTQQPPTSGRMAAADLSVNGQKEEVPSATVVRHIGGGSDLDDRMCESKQPR